MYITVFITVRIKYHSVLYEILCNMLYVPTVSTKCLLCLYDNGLAQFKVPLI